MNRNQRRMAAFNARKEFEQRERESYTRKIDEAFTKLSEGCNCRVLKAINSTEYKMKMRSKPAPEAVSRENPKHQKVANEAGRQIHAVQKMRGKSIPLI